jgi:prepilin-type N-terminal cleavage/methylation domain-containing protein
LPLVPGMKSLLPGRKSESGFSLVEMMVVVGIAGVLTAMAVVQIGLAKSAMQGDAAMRSLMAAMNQAREAAITQRRNMRMVFDANNRIQIIREEVPGPATTVVATVLFEGGMKYLKLVTTDTLDQFGNTNPVNLPTASGTPPEVKFTPEGKFVNQAGQTLNATVLIARTNTVTSQRAATIMGSTGRVRAFRWDGTKWVLV